MKCGSGSEEYIAIANGTMKLPAPGMPGTLFVVATPIGNLEDITLRALRVLREAHVVAAEDTRRTGLFCGITTSGPHSSASTSTTSMVGRPTCVARLLAGDVVALVSDAGTPLVSDPGFRLVRDAIAAGVAVEASRGPRR